MVGSSNVSWRLAQPAAAALMTLALATGAASPTARADSPSFALGGISCLTGQIRAYPPRWMMPVYEVNAVSAEEVRWQPVLRRRVWTGRRYRWRTVDRSSPDWFAGTYLNSAGGASFVQTIYGQAWSDPTSGRQLVSGYPLAVERAGVYKVRNWLYWGALDGWYTKGSKRCTYE
jgi:hypothetical protein